MQCCHQLVTQFWISSIRWIFWKFIYGAISCLVFSFLTRPLLFDLLLYVSFLWPLHPDYNPKFLFRFSTRHGRFACFFDFYILSSIHFSIFNTISTQCFLCIYDFYTSCVQNEPFRSNTSMIHSQRAPPIRRKMFATCFTISIHTSQLSAYKPALYIFISENQRIITAVRLQK